MKTMLQDGIIKVCEGKTTLEEVYRVVGSPNHLHFELVKMYRNQKVVKEINMTTSEIIIEYFKNHPHLLIEKENNPIIKY